MKMKTYVRNYRIPCFIMLLSFLFVSIVFIYINRYDNKYTSPIPPLSENHAVMNEEWLETHKITVLVDGWDIKMISPGGGADSEFEPTFIGQFGTYARGDRTATPYGRAQYRIKLTLPEGEDGTYLMLLPEVFSAGRVMIDGHVVRTLGNTDEYKYEPFVKNLLIPIPGGTSELLVDTANYTHYYSGITYPPLIGTYDSVMSAVTAQMLLYSFLCFFPLGAGLLSLAFWFSRRRSSLYLVYSIMSLCFSVYISYPLTRYLGIHAVRFFYALEDGAFYAMVLCAVYISQLLLECTDTKLHQAVAAIGLMFCLLPAVTSYLLAPMYTGWVNISGQIINLYKTGISIYLILMAVWGVWRQKGNRWMTVVNFVFAFGLLADVLTAGLFEPIRGLWQTEYVSCAVIAIFTGMMIRNYHDIVTENEQLTKHLSDEVDRKTGHLITLLNERRQLLSGIAHDMKAPIAVIKAYIDMIRLENVQIDEEAAEYISIIDRKSSGLEQQILELQRFNAENISPGPAVFCSLQDFVRGLYEDTKPYADANGIYYDLLLREPDTMLNIRREQLSRALENIVLNAVEHTPMEGYMVLEAAAECGSAVITVRDTGCGISEEELPHIFEYRFSGKKEGSGDMVPRGIGLYFARNAVMEHGGVINVQSSAGKGTEFKITLPAESA